MRFNGGQARERGIGCVGAEQCWWLLVRREDERVREKRREVGEVVSGQLDDEELTGKRRRGRRRGVMGAWG